MPSTNDHEHHTPDALDDLSTLSSSSANSQSTCTNDIYANEDEEEDFDDGEVSASKQLGGGNRLVNLVDLDKALTSIACCQKCSEKSQTAAIDAFINFCEGKMEKYLVPVNLSRNTMRDVYGTLVLGNFTMNGKTDQLAE
jgi:hypothetical protein